MIGPCIGITGNGFAKDGVRAADIPLQQMRLGTGGGEIIRRLRNVGARVEPFEHLSRDRRGLSRLAREQRQRGDVDQRIGCRREPVGPRISGRGLAEQAAPIVSRRQQRAVLEQTSRHAERGGIVCQPVISGGVEQGPCVIERARARMGGDER